jgi:hypothetical protein
LNNDVHQAKLASIGSALRSIAETAQKPNKDNYRNLRIHDGVEYCLPPESVALHAEQVRALLGEQDWSARFSSAYLARLLNSQLAEVLKDDGYDLNGGLSRSLDECSKSGESVDVYLALEGVRYKLLRPLQLGDVTISHGGEDFLAEARSKLSIVSAGALGTDETKASAESLIWETFNEELSGQSVIRFTVIAEPERAMERAREEARFVLALLRFVSKFVYPLAEDMRFGLRGERTTVNSYGFVASDQRFHTLPQRRGSLMPFELNQQFSDKLSILGLIDFAERRSHGRLSAIDRRIEKALHWLSIGLIQEEPATALVTMTISMEALFSRGPGQSIASAVAESTAFLLGKADGGGRRRIANHMHEFYKKRNGLAHGGSVVVSSSDLTLLTYLVVSAIRALLEKRNDIADPDGLYAWIDGLKYG